MLSAAARHRRSLDQLLPALQRSCQPAGRQHDATSSCSCPVCISGSSLVASTAACLPPQHCQLLHGSADRLPRLLHPLNWSFSQQASFAKASKKKQDSKVAVESDVFDVSAASQQMSKAIEYLEQELASVRTGRASAGLLDHIKVQMYGQKMPMKAAANISVRDAQTIVVTAFDPSTVSALEKAISSSALGLNPKIEGQELVVPVPRPTKETLAAMAKLIGQSSEGAKVKLRQIRKAAVSDAKQIPSEDDQKRAEKQVQQLTDEHVANVDRLCGSKQKELQVL